MGVFYVPERSNYVPERSNYVPERSSLFANY